MDNQYLLNLDGLIDGDYFRVETDSKKVIKTITELMDPKDTKYTNSPLTKSTPDVDVGKSSTSSAISSSLPTFQRNKNGDANSTKEETFEEKVDEIKESFDKKIANLPFIRSGNKPYAEDSKSAPSGCMLSDEQFQKEVDFAHKSKEKSAPRCKCGHIESEHANFVSERCNHRFSGYGYGRRCDCKKFQEDALSEPEDKDE